MYCIGLMLLCKKNFTSLSLIAPAYILNLMFPGLVLRKFMIAYTYFCQRHIMVHVKLFASCFSHTCFGFFMFIFPMFIACTVSLSIKWKEPNKNLKHFYDIYKSQSFQHLKKFYDTLIYMFHVLHKCSSRSYKQYCTSLVLLCSLPQVYCMHCLITALQIVWYLKPFLCYSNKFSLQEKLNISEMNDQEALLIIIRKIYRLESCSL